MKTLPLSFDEIIQQINRQDNNLYDFALYTSEKGLQYHSFQPIEGCWNSYSIAKAFVMTAIGLLWDEGFVKLTSPVARYLPLPENAPLGWKLVTVEHALTHGIGFGANFLDVETENVNDYPTDDYLKMIFMHPLNYLPGQRRVYSDAAFYLVSRLVSAISGEDADAFLYRRLFKPLLFGETAWSRCPMGYPLGATGLFISARDMVKLGALYLNGGVCGGKRLISQAWINRVYAREYELHVMTANGLIGKGGMYGQGLVISREQGFSAAWHAYKKHNAGMQMIQMLDNVRR